MGALPLDTYMLCPIDYVTFGLKNPINGTQEKPHVLSLLSTFLDASVRENERLLEGSQTKNVITIFHGLKPPSLTIQQYIDRIYKYSCCSPSCMVIAHVYLDRYIERTNIYLTSFNIHRLLITSIMVAAKFMDDAFFNNAYYAKVGGVSTAEINKLEMKFLFGLDFRLHVDVQTFGKYCALLKKKKQGGVSGGLVERSIHACGEKERWTKKKDDSSCQSIAR